MSTLLTAQRAWRISASRSLLIGLVAPLAAAVLFDYFEVQAHGASLARVGIGLCIATAVAVTPIVLFRALDTLGHPSTRQRTFVLLGTLVLSVVWWALALLVLINAHFAFGGSE